MSEVSSNEPNQFSSLGNTPTYRAGVVQSAAYRMLKKFTEDCLTEYGITTMQWFIIGTIHDAGPVGIGVTALSKAVDTNVPYITNTLNLLEQRGFINRQTRLGDNRSKVVTIAEAYEPTVIKIENELRQKMRNTIYSQITPQELHTYISVLHKLSNSLERYS